MGCVNIHKGPGASVDREKWLEAAPARTARRVALVFLLPSIAWIVFSDRVAEALFTDPDTLSLFQTIKGLLYVCGITAILYGVVRALITTFAERTRAALAAKEAGAEALRQAQAESQALERAKSQFLSSVSHELRTPLNAVIGFSEMLGQRDIASNPERVRDYAGEIATAGHNLLELVQGIVACAEAEVGRPLQVERLDLRGELLRAAGNARIRALHCRTDVVVEVPPDLVIRADAIALQQILFALLDNAIAHTPPQTRVVISGKALDDGGVQVVVADDGPGMPETLRAAIGKPFLRGADPMTAGVGGLGLGLYLAALLIRRHGGDLDVDTVGGGTRVMLRFPGAGFTPASR
jgi:two-component system cell cycle sensor histidine kinase PleC